MKIQKEPIFAWRFCYPLAVACAIMMPIRIWQRDWTEIAITGAFLILSLGCFLVLKD